MPFRSRPSRPSCDTSATYPSSWSLAVTTLTHALADLASERLLLGGLPDDAVADLAASSGHTLHPSMVSTLTRHTMGNPRDVLALLDEVPATVWSQPDADFRAHHLLARTRDELETCGPDGPSFVEAMAVLGEAGSLAEATMLAGSTTRCKPSTARSPPDC